MNRRARVMKMAMRALKHIEIAWKLCREIAEVEPHFFGQTGNVVNDSAHAHVKPHLNAMEATIRHSLKKYDYNENPFVLHRR